MLGALPGPECTSSHLRWNKRNDKPSLIPVSVPMPQGPGLYKLSWHLLWQINPTFVYRQETFLSHRKLNKRQRNRLIDKEGEKYGKGRISHFFIMSTVKASSIFQGDLFNEMTSFLQESVVNGFHTTLLATGDLGRWRAREQYLPPECQQFPIRHLNCKTLWKTLYKTVHGISPAWHHGIPKKKYSAAEKLEMKTACWYFNMIKLKIRLKKADMV